MSSLDGFTQQVDAVLAAPYPCSLLVLNRFLEHLTTNELSVWVLAKPCQIDLLIARLTQRLAYDEVVVPILVKLIQQQALCESLCRQTPEVLERIFSHAVVHLNNAAVDAFQHYACLLELPLPATFGFPAAYPELVGLLLPIQAAESASAWLQRFRRFVASLRSVDFLYLNDDLLTKCYDQWRSLCRSPNHYDATTAVYIGALLYRLWSSDYGSDRSSPSMIMERSQSVKMWSYKLASMFSGDKASHIIATTVLRILKFCSDTSLESVATSLDAVKMAQVILALIGPLEIGSWVKQNPQAIFKIVQKTTRSNMNPQLSAEVLLALCSIDITFALTDHALLTAGLTRIFDGRFDMLDHGSSEFSSIRHKLVRRSMLSLESSDKLHFECMLEHMLSYILQQCQPNTSVSIENAFHQKRAMLLLEILQSELDEAHPIILDVVCKLNVPEWWPLNLLCAEAINNCISSTVCTHEFAKRRLRITSTLSFLVLRAASSSAKQISPNVFKLLENQIQELPNLEPLLSCQFVWPEAPVLGKQNGPTDVSRSVFKPKTVHEDFGRIAEKWSLEVEAYVHTLCKDLQDRCDGIETPLHAAKSQNQDLKAEIGALKLKLEDLQASETALHSTVYEKEQRLAGLESQLEQSHDQNELLQKQVSAFEVRLRCNAEESAGALKLVADQADATVAAVEDNHREQVLEFQIQLETKTTSVRTLQKELEFMTQCALEDRNELILKHEAELSKLNEAYQHKVVATELRFSELNQSVSTLRTELARAESASMIDIENCQTLRIKHSEEVQRNAGLKDIISKHEVEAQNSMECFKLEKTKVEQLLQAQSENEHQLGQNVARIAQLEKAFDASQCEVKALKQALKKARLAEKRVLAIFQSSHNSAVRSTSSTINSPPISPIIEDIGIPAATELQTNSFLSLDDDDYAEISDLDQC